VEATQGAVQAEATLAAEVQASQAVAVQAEAGLANDSI